MPAGRCSGLYRKMHIPDDPRFYEKYYFTPGDLGFRCFDTRYARIAPLICWDQWYPEGARLAALGGAQILFYPTAIGFHHSDAAEAGTQHDAWETIQRSHAIANGVYVAAVNRVGHEGPEGDGLEFWGGSFVSDPQGRMLAKARRCRRDADCGMRPARDRIRAPQLALSARPPDRRVRTHREPGDRLKAQTPRRRGFRMPAEWEPHEATWIAWPHNREDWPGRFTPIPWVYGEIVRKLAAVERVRILVQSPALEAQARRILEKVGANLDAVEFFQRETDRVWTRDYCPLFVKNRRGEIALTAWRFNAWAKYDDWRKDATIPAFLGKRLKLPVFTPEMVLEGGSIDVNGQGLLLTTEECLLSPIQARNPDLSRGEIERRLREYLGVARVIWLKNGIAGDDTHGHVDDLARFVNPETVVLCAESDPADAATLRSAGLKVVKLPMPRPLWFDGRQLPASYANFYIANGLVLVPTFNDPNDRAALTILAQAVPRIAKWWASTARSLIWGLGALHCMTQQQPAA